MAKYRTKPVIVDAMQWTGDVAAMEAWLQRLGAPLGGVMTDCARKGDERVAIWTLDGEVHARIGDYVVRDTMGQFYPYEQSVFKQTHEPANDPAELDMRIRYESFLMSCIRGGETTEMSFREFCDAESRREQRNETD